MCADTGGPFVELTVARHRRPPWRDWGVWKPPVWPKEGCLAMACNPLSKNLPQKARMAPLEIPSSMSHAPAQTSDGARYPWPHLTPQHASVGFVDRPPHCAVEHLSPLGSFRTRTHEHGLFVTLVSTHSSLCRAGVGLGALERNPRGVGLGIDLSTQGGAASERHGTPWDRRSAIPQTPPIGEGRGKGQKLRLHQNMVWNESNAHGTRLLAKQEIRG